MMTLTYKGLSKNGKNAFYTGAATILRFPLSAFVNKQAPQMIEIEGDLAEPKQPKPKLTAEERKALRASQPKPTEAEKIRRAEENLAKRKAKLNGAEASM